MAQRLDVFLTEKHDSKSRESAKRAICSGLVTVNGLVVKKPSFLVEGHEDIVITKDENTFVGRGGLKLKKAIDSFNIHLTNLVCMDIGASTGGFCDCMLQNGARKVYAVDVGTGQLSKQLLADYRVINLEKTDVRGLDLEDFRDVSFVSVDVSFISVCLVLPIVAELITPSGEGVVLIKPQFEAGRSRIGKGGIVKDKNVHRDVLIKVIEFAKSLGLTVRHLTFSPISNGNIEYLLHLKKEENDKETVEKNEDSYQICDIINEAYAFFGT